LKRLPLKRGSSRLKRGAPLRRIGHRGLATRKELEVSRVAVMTRAKGRCERCGRASPLEVHHKRMRSQGGTHEPSNLAALCFGCHNAVHDGTAHDAALWIVRRGGVA
jgi:5-methylcytosine-specific restriction endonuclease McrA